MEVRTVFSRSSRVVSLLVLFSLGFLLCLYSRHWPAVDRCLDAGGAYDYGQQRCVFDSYSNTLNFVIGETTCR